MGTSSSSSSNPKHREPHGVNVRLSLILSTVPIENGPEIRGKLCIYFQSKQGGNCGVEYIRLLGEDDNGSSWYRVAFDKPSGVSHVLSRSDHVMVVDGVKIPLKVQGCPAPPGTSVSSSAETGKDTEGGVTEQNQATSGDETQCQMTSIGGSRDTQKGTSSNAATFNQHEATQQLLSPEKRMKVDPVNQVRIVPDMDNIHTGKDTEGGVTEQNQATCGDETQCQMTSIGGSGDTQKRTSRNAATFNQHEATQQMLSPEKRMKVDPVTQVLCEVPTCRAPPGLGNQHLTDSSNQRGSADMYGRDEHPQPQGPQLLGHIVPPTSHQAQGDLSGIWAPQAGTMATNILNYPYLWHGGSITNQNIHLQEFFRNQPLGYNQLCELNELCTGKQGDHFAGIYPSDMFSPNQFHMMDQRPPFTRTCSPPGEDISPNLTHKLPIGEQKQTVAQTGTSPGGMLENASGVNNQQAGRADTNKQDQRVRRRPGAAVQTSLDGESPSNADSDIKKDNLQDDAEEDEQLIEVTGFKQSKDDEVLKLYFENQRKSGGGEIEMMERDSKTGAVRITFTNPSVASTVAGKKHKLSGDTLKVKLITKKKRRPLPIKAQCLFLKGIPDGCSSEHVKLFIENRVSMDEEPTVRYGEKPGTAICTFSHDIPGVSQDLEMIELYFDNKKKSGGSGVTDVQPGPMDGQAVVYFDDWKVVEDVLAKSPHKLGGTELLVESYHDFLERLSQFDAPTPHIPKSVSVQVQEPIMEFLYGKGKNTKTKLLKELTKVKASLQWPDGSQKSQAKLEPVIDDSQCQSSWLNWNKEAVYVLTDFMKGYKTVRVPVPQSLWKDAADTLKKMTTTCSMVPDAQHYAVILVGDQQDVDVTEAEINDTIKKLQKDAEYNAEQAKEDIQWDAEKLQLFTLCGIKQEIEKSFPALKITVFSSNGKTGINLDGIRKTIKEVELQIRRMMDSLEKTEFKAGSIKVRFVQHAPDKIHEVLGSQNIRAACSGSDDGKITIYGATRRDVRQAKAYIDDEINEDMIAIKVQPALAVLQGHDGKKLLDCINNQKFVMACISHETVPRCVELAGFKRNLSEAKKQIINFLKKNVIIKSIIPSNENKVRLITTFHGRELERVRQQHQQNLVAFQPHMSGRNRGFIIQGNEEGLEAVRQLVTSLVEAVKEKQYSVSKTGMAKLFRENKGQIFLETVEKEFHCVINTNWQEGSNKQAAGTDYHRNTAASDYVAVFGSEGVEDDKKEEELQETVILQLFAMDLNSLKMASDKLDRFQDGDFFIGGQVEVQHSIRYGRLW